jgi:predicted amidophosphoribosyltransferase
MPTPNQFKSLSRFRLRFLLQEFDLPPGDTMVGRSEDCRITLFDPLISRRHARIRVTGESAILEDLGSRNGCRVNGVPIKGPQLLHDGDRIRIGTQELVFCDTSSAPNGRQHRPTGSLFYCANCKMAFPEEMGACPGCGARSSSPEVHEKANEKAPKTWALDLLIEMLERAVKSDRLIDADRIMRQAATTLHERLSTPPYAEKAQIEALAKATLKMAEVQQTTIWAPTIMDAYRLAGIAMPADMAEAFARYASTQVQVNYGEETTQVYTLPPTR